MDLKQRGRFNYYVLFLIAVLFVNIHPQDNVHNSRNSVDWNGTYSGRILSSNKEVVCIVVELFENGTYKLSLCDTNNIEKAKPLMGRFRWNKKGKIVVLKKVSAITNRFKVGENVLLPIYPKGINKKFTEKYKRLEKTPTNELGAELTLLNREWILSVMDEERVQLKNVYIYFDEKEVRFRGNAGCNNYSGNFSLKDNRLKLSNSISTKMFCPNMNVEDKYLNSLSTIGSYKISQQKLYLLDINNKVTLEYDFIHKTNQDME